MRVWNLLVAGPLLVFLPPPQRGEGWGGGAAPPNPGESSPSQPGPWEVESARSRPDLTRMFTRTDGWTGSDGAYSIPLGPDRTLWLFGDTFVGRVVDGRRVGARMISNTAAWQSLARPAEPPRFFWDASGKEPAALLKPERADEWYWPGDGALVDGQFCLFARRTRHREQGAPGFQFAWVGNDLLRIANPLDEPTAWRFDRTPMGEGPDAWRPGVACLLDGEYLYTYGLFPEKSARPLEAPIALARIRRDRLKGKEITDWEYRCQGPTGEHWSDKPDRLAPLFRDGATEMTVTRVRGLDGYVATYFPLGISRDIVIRHAPRPEGPWGRPLTVYRCPAQDKDVFLYAAKAHPELAERDGQLIITYCRNVGALGEHMRRPGVYAPQFVEVQLRKAR